MKHFILVLVIDTRCRSNTLLLITSSRLNVMIYRLNNLFSLVLCIVWNSCYFSHTKKSKRWHYSEFCWLKLVPENEKYFCWSLEGTRFVPRFQKTTSNSWPNHFRPTRNTASVTSFILHYRKHAYRQFGWR